MSLFSQKDVFLNCSAVKYIADPRDLQKYASDFIQLDSEQTPADIHHNDTFLADHFHLMNVTPSTLKRSQESNSVSKPQAWSAFVEGQ